MTDKAFQYAVLSIMLFMLSELHDNYIIVIIDIVIAVVFAILAVKEL